MANTHTYVTGSISGGRLGIRCLDYVTGTQGLSMRLTIQSAYRYNRSQENVAFALQLSRTLSLSRVLFERDPHRFGSNDPKTSTHVFSAEPVVRREVGLSEFLTRVYARSAVGIVGSVGIGCLMIPVAEANPIACFAVGAVSGFASIFGITNSEPVFRSRTEPKTGEFVHSSENSLGREISFGALSLGMGIMLAPMMSIVVSIDPAIVPASLMITSGILGGCAYVSSRCSDTVFMNWKGPLMVGLGTLIGTQLLGLGSLLIFGENSLSMMLNNIDVYGGIVLFTGFGLYDSYIARATYASGKPDDLHCAANIYLDGMNIMIRTMEIMAKLNKK